MRSAVVASLAAGLVVLVASPALADPPAPALPPLPAALTADLSTAESAELATLTAGSGVRLDAFVRTPAGPTVVTLDAGSTAQAQQAAALLDAQPSVQGAGLDRVVHATGTPGSLGTVTAQNSVTQWDLPKINATGARSMVAGGLPSVTVAVLDTGIAANPQLTPYLVPGYNFSESDWADPNDTADHNSHGTHVAGTIGASVQATGVEGVAAGVKLMPVKVLDDTGSGYTSDIANGIVWAADHGADVINMSLGGPGDDPAMETAISYARGKGVVVVAAAGNDAQNGDPLDYPGASPGVIGVGATDSSDQWAWFSEHGPQVDVTAPGVGIVSLYLDTNQPLTDDGTSMASPHVAAIAADLKAISRSFTPDQVQTLIQNNAVDLGDPGRDDLYGYGRVDALATVTAGFTAAGQTPPTDHAPVTVPDGMSATAGSTGYTFVDAKGNDSDPDGDELSYTAVTRGAEGAVSLNVATQQIGYLADAGATGTDTFTYTVSDGRGRTATGTVTVTIAAANPLQRTASLTAAPSPGSVALSWVAVPNATGYDLYRNGQLLQPVAGTTYTDSTVTNGTTYGYQVAALDSGNAEGKYSALVTATPQAAAAALPAPTGLAATPQPGGASLTWATVGGATAYRVYRNGSYVGFVYGGSFVDADLTTGTYGYQVAAADANGLPGTLSGTVNATVATPAPDAMGALYQNLGGIRSALGRSMTGEYARAGGTVRNYMFGWILLAPGSSVAHYSLGAVNAAYVAAGGPDSALGFPLADPVVNMVNGGAGQMFQGGSIYWSPATGAHVVTGAIRTWWSAWGTQNGTLGYPIADPVGGMVNGGSGQMFQGGSIYSSPATGPHVVTGAIRTWWSAWGTQNGALGYPIADPVGGMLYGGSGQMFQGGSIYSSSVTGAHVVTGAIRDRWSASGTQDGALGYPTSDPYGVSGGTAQNFQRGTITWTQRTNRTSVTYR